MLLEEVALASADVAATPRRLAKIERLAGCLALAGPEEVGVAVAYLAGELPHERIGVGWATLRELPAPAGETSLELLEVDEALRRVGAATGAGSQAVRRSELGGLFSRATEREQRFLTALLLGDLRQGALAGVMADAVAKAAGVPAAAVRRAAMLAGDLGAAAAAALAGGDALAEFRLTPFRPLQPMLAQTAETLADALARISPAALEWKLDGARLQVHRSGGEVRAYTRTLADVTARVPEVVAAALALDAESAVLDSEVIALDADGRPRPFQETMSRFGSKSDRDGLRASVPLAPFFFDVLHLDGADLLDSPGQRRAEALAACVPEQLRVPRLETADEAAAERFLAAALERGHEGVMVKALDAPYEAGRRGAGWLKVKPVHTLDLVVLAAEWGHGRRRGKLSNIHVGARDAASGGFVMLGKTFKGMTDELLAWQTEHFLALEAGREGHVVRVRPELVVEVAFDGVQASSRYAGGLALRFARVKGYRPDKHASEADTIETVRAIHEGGRVPGGG
ncbi:MAG TPA: ATP-dependent DNA ligase [Gaiellaceae bacterium]|nr:ATP-dependent DNA ligase [Gaiellaceae bacterium]